jgi:hypothetical protein
MNLSNMMVHIRKAIQGNFFSKLIRNNTGVSSKNFFLVMVTFVGVALLAMPIYILITETYYNHTIATNLSDMAAYIAAVAAVFTSVGLTKVWGEKNEHRLPGPDGILGTDDDVIVKMTDEEYAKFMVEFQKLKLRQENATSGQYDTYSTGNDCCNSNEFDNTNMG